MAAAMDLRRRWPAAAAIAVLCGATSAAEWPTPQAALDFIGHLEAPEGYDQAHSAAPPPPRPLTRMAIRDVLAWQASIRPTAVSTAAGRYQIIHATLKRLVKAHDIDAEQPFDAALQDRLGALLLGECGYARRSRRDVANCLAGTWAALPRVSGPGAGRSAWHGIAGNRALVSPDEVLAFLGGDGARHRPSPAADIVADIPRASISWRIVQPAMDRAIQDARDRDTLGSSVRIRLDLDPYQTQ